MSIVWFQLDHSLEQINNIWVFYDIICPCLFNEIMFECCFRQFNNNCRRDLSVTSKLCVNVVSKFLFPSFILSIEAFCKGCAVSLLSSFLSPFLTCLTLLYAIEPFFFRNSNMTPDSEASPPKTLCQGIQFHTYSYPYNWLLPAVK